MDDTRLSSSPSTYEKGLAFELLLSQTFEEKGYKVLHNVKRKGRSGVEHQIDVLAQHLTPLYTSTVVIEAKSYDTPIDKDRVMKLIQVVDDIGADRGIIVTTSEFTPSAIKTAEGHNIDLWDRQRLVELLGEARLQATEKALERKAVPTGQYVSFTVGLQDIRNRVESQIEERRRGGFLGVGKVHEELLGIHKRYYPYYEAQVLVTVTEIRKTGLLSKEKISKLARTSVSVDGIMGDLVTLTPDGVAYPYGYLPSLTEDELRVLKACGGKSFTQGGVMGLGYSAGKVRRIVNGLVNKGVLAVGGGRPVAYSPRVPFPYDPTALKSITGVHAVGQNVEKDVEVWTPKADPSAVMNTLELCWPGCQVAEITSVYYPYYFAVIKMEDGSMRFEWFDGVTGKQNQALNARAKAASAS